jgi:hypothetical protein
VPTTAVVSWVWTFVLSIYVSFRRCVSRGLELEPCNEATVWAMRDARMLFPPQWMICWESFGEWTMLLRRKNPGEVEEAVAPREADVHPREMW